MGKKTSGRIRKRFNPIKRVNPGKDSTSQLSSDASDIIKIRSQLLSGSEAAIGEALSNLVIACENHENVKPIVKHGVLNWLIEAVASSQIVEAVSIECVQSLLALASLPQEAPIKQLLDVDIHSVLNGLLQASQNDIVLEYSVKVLVELCYAIENSYALIDERILFELMQRTQNQIIVGSILELLMLQCQTKQEYSELVNNSLHDMRSKVDQQQRVLLECCIIENLCHAETYPSNVQSSVEQFLNFIHEQVSDIGNQLDAPRLGNLCQVLEYLSVLFESNEGEELDEEEVVDEMEDDDMINQDEVMIDNVEDAAIVKIVDGGLVDYLRSSLISSQLFQSVLSSIASQMVLVDLKCLCTLTSFICSLLSNAQNIKLDQQILLETLNSISQVVGSVQEVQMRVLVLLCYSEVCSVTSAQLLSIGGSISSNQVTNQLLLVFESLYQLTVSEDLNNNTNRSMSQIVLAIRTNLMSLLDVVVQSPCLNEQQLKCVSLFMVNCIESQVGSGSSAQVSQYSPTVLSEVINAFIDLYGPDTYNQFYADNVFLHKKLKALSSTIKVRVKAINPRQSNASNYHDQLSCQVAQELQLSDMTVIDYVALAVDVDYRNARLRLSEMNQNLVRFLKYKDQQLK
ncbi:hypothetical protein MIR68_011747 [Amoeboaphelidium protococcarum]|nr:hypothetical protein MIR68_011747 [Amoeboaphelidium protococcarum]